MFRTPRVNVIESDEGFTVEVLGRVGLLYTEASRTMHIDSELLASPGSIAVFAKSIRAWDSPFDGEIVDEAKRDAIIDNICRAFRFKGEWVSVM